MVDFDVTGDLDVQDPDVLRYSAFAATPEGGNPAGVVLDAGGLDDERMLRIAVDVGYSETAFLTARIEGTGVPRYRVRYWSPAAEVPFCGHATIATAVALAERDGPGEVIFATGAGDVALRSSTDAAGTIAVSFTSVEPEVRDMDQDVLDRLLALLGLVPSDLDERFPPKESFAGNRHPILVLHDRELFDQFRFSPAAVAALMREQGWAGTVTVLHAAGPADFDARNLFPVGRITEDPATGSAAASTGAYLRAVGHPEREIRIHQGAHVRRPSMLAVTIPDVGGIVVSGGAFRIDTGVGAPRSEKKRAIRNIAVGLPVKHGHVLALSGFDHTRELNFLRAIGGGIEFGERAEDALHREFMEELGVRLQSVRLLDVRENIFTYEGKAGHEISHIYAVTSAELDALPLDAQLTVLDEGSPVRWVPIADLRDDTRPLFPEGARELLRTLGE